MCVLLAVVLIAVARPYTCACVRVLVLAHVLTCVRVVVQTADMLWSYEVRGAPPEYRAPNVVPRIDNHMDPATMSMMAAKAEQSKSRNILRENMSMGVKKSSGSSVAGSRT